MVRSAPLKPPEKNDLKLKRNLDLAFEFGLDDFEPFVQMANLFSYTKPTANKLSVNIQINTRAVNDYKVAVKILS